MMNATLRNIIITVVALVWAINFTAPIVIRDYQPAPELNVAFMAIIGALTQIKTKEETVTLTKNSESNPPGGTGA